MFQYIANKNNKASFQWNLDSDDPKGPIAECGHWKACLARDEPYTPGLIIIESKWDDRDGNDVNVPLPEFIYLTLFFTYHKRHEGFFHPFPR